MTNLKGKVAVVTGGSGGIGGSIAFHLGMCGVKVVVHYSSKIFFGFGGFGFQGRVPESTS